MRVKRLDFSTLEVEKFRRTPSGGLVIPAALTRTGIFVYRTQDGGEVREYRSPEEVFSPASLASIQGAPVTVDHPPEMVVPDNWKEYARGHLVEGSVAREDPFLTGDLAIEDGPTLQKVEKKELRELSCGYSCEVEDSPGTTPEGERYDRLQKNIVYNHVALGPAGWGRAGSSVGLRLDSRGDLVDTRASTSRKPWRQQRMKLLHRVGKTLVISGVNYDCSSQKGLTQARQALKGLVQPRLDEGNAVCAKKDASLEEVKSCLIQCLGMLDEMMQSAVPEEPVQDAGPADPNAEEKPPVSNQDAEAQPQPADPAKDQEKMDSAVHTRVTIIERAKQFNPSLEYQGKSNAAIMRETLDSAKVQHKGLSDEAVYGAFLAIPLPRKDGGVSPVSLLNQATTRVPENRVDSSQEEDLVTSIRKNWEKASKGKK